MKTKRYVFSSLLILTLMFSFGSRVSAESENSGSGSANASVKASASLKADVVRPIKISADAKSDQGIETNGARFKTIADLEVARKAEVERCAKMQAGTDSNNCYKTLSEKFQIKRILKPNDDKNNIERTNILVGLRLGYDRVLSHLSDHLAKFTQLANLLEKRGAELKAQGIATADAQSRITKAREHLRNASAAIETAKKLWANLNTNVTVQADSALTATKNAATDPAAGSAATDVVVRTGTNSTDSAASASGMAKIMTGSPSESARNFKNVFAPVKAQIETARKELGSARKELMEAVKLMRGSGSDDDKNDDKRNKESDDSR